MNTYRVTFQCCDEFSRMTTVEKVFYAEDIVDLAEQILEVQEDMEDECGRIVISKEITKL